MKTFLIGLVLILAGVFALSWYRGWIHLKSDRTADSPSVTVSVDKEKLHDDQAKALGAAKVATEKATATTGKSMD